MKVRLPRSFQQQFTANVATRAASGPVASGNAQQISAMPPLFLSRKPRNPHDYLRPCHDSGRNSGLGATGMLVRLLLALFLVVILVPTAEAKSVDEQAAELVRGRAVVLFDSGNYQAARSRLEIAVALHESVPARLLLGRTHLALGDCTKALGTLASLHLAGEKRSVRRQAELVRLETQVACDSGRTD